MRKKMIKFRVWNELLELYIPKEIADKLTLKELNKKGYIAEQWTGLKDKNGKDIYVGDIVSHDTFDYLGNITKTEVGICRYNDKWGVFMFHTSEDINKSFTFFSAGYETENSTIIGNINKNKEML